MSSAFTLFETTIGRCGIAWGNRGVLGVQLPETGGEARTRARVRRRLADAREAAAPPEVQEAIDRIVDLLRGEASDLSTVALDMDGVPEFNRHVYEVARTIPAGETLTYGEVADRLGDRGAARDVGRALAQNPFPLIAPCHRVRAAGGGIGGFSAPGGITTKRRLLMIEDGGKSTPLFRSL